MSPLGREVSDEKCWGGRCGHLLWGRICGGNDQLCAEERGGGEDIGRVNGLLVGPLASYQP